MYGTYKVFGEKLYGGECLLTNPQGHFRFKIKDAVNRNPELKDPQVDQAIAKQEKEFKLDANTSPM